MDNKFNMEKAVDLLNKKLGEAKKKKGKKLTKKEKVEIIDRLILEIEKEIENIKGSETEVYTRIVGYYRSVKGWNKGKRKELEDRLVYDVEKSLKNKGV